MCHRSPVGWRVRWGDGEEMEEMEMTDATARAGLYSRLSEVLGVDHAGTLMAFLPGDEPATKNDLVALKSELTARMDRFEDKMDGFHDALLYQGRTYVMASVGSILTTAALVAGIVRVL